MFFTYILCICMFIFVITTLLLEFDKSFKHNKLKIICFIQIINVLVLLWLVITSVVFMIEMKYGQLLKTRVNTTTYYNKESDLETKNYAYYINPYNENLENFPCNMQNQNISYVNIPQRTFGGISFFHAKDLNYIVKKNMGIK